MSGVISLTEDVEEKIEEINPNSMQVVMNTINEEGLIVKEANELCTKDEDMKEDEFFLQVEEEDADIEDQSTQFMTLEGECEENEEDQLITLQVEEPDHIILTDKNVIIWNKLCRICANESDKFIPIFSDEGSEHELQNKIEMHLPLKVTQEDTLPIQLCYNCAATLIAWHDMSKGCLAAQERLMEFQNQLNAKEQYEEPNEETDNTDIHVETENFQNEDIQNEEIAEVEEANEEITESATEENEESSLRLRNEKEPLEKFNDFRKSYKPRIRQPIKENEAEDEEIMKEVPVPKIAPRKRSARIIQKKLRKLPSEPENTITSPKQDPLELESLPSPEIKPDDQGDDEDDDFHIDDEIIEIEEFEDEDQPAPTKQKKTRRKPGTSKELNCDECGKKFRQIRSYDSHMRIHTGERPFTCHVCGKQFGQSGSLYYHLRHVHGGVKNHACDICGRCFAMKTAMEDHRRIHTGERPYVCDSCGKTFKTKASLYIHSKVHTDEYPFACSFCKKPFRWKQQMISHETTHTGEKKHICDICGKGFGVKNELTRHRRTHSSDKPFTCLKCGVSFGQKRYLTNHNRTRHKDKNNDTVTS